MKKTIAFVLLIGAGSTASLPLALPLLALGLLAAL